MDSKRKMMEAFEAECSRFGYDFTKQEGWEDEYEDGETANAWDQWQEAVAYAAREAARVAASKFRPAHLMSMQGAEMGQRITQMANQVTAEQGHAGKIISQAILAHFGIDPKEKV